MDTRATLGRDLGVACLLALILGATWAWRDWGNLAQLRLPDTDDVVRLQQVRDWLAGQAYADVTQHRIGPATPMHWTRVADLGPAALILALKPLLGAHGAQVAAVTIWPVLLFALALLLVARIARTLDPRLAGTATAVAALAYPAATLFLPGRIDHHGLQMVLLLGAVLCIVRPAGLIPGAFAGLLAAGSLAVGLETAPLFAALGLVAVAEWVEGRPGASDRLAGLGLGALTGLMVANSAFATSGWSFPACDGFTGAAWRAGIVLALAPLLLAGLDKRLDRAWNRAVAALAVCATGGLLALWVAPSCLQPYGAVDPAMARLWLDEVGEAQSFTEASLSTVIGYVGVTVAGIAAGLWRLRAEPRRGWATLLCVQAAALAVAAVQLRGAYAGALLAAPGLAALIVHARTRGGLAIAGAWAASAGILYPLAAQALPERSRTAPTAAGDCASPAMLARLDSLPVGLVVAPMDAGPYILAGTRQHVLAAPYHRNGPANLASYRFYLGAPAEASAITGRWHVRYWLSCAAMPGVGRANGLPSWRRIAQLSDGAAIWARDGLSGMAARR